MGKQYTSSSNAITIYGIKKQVTKDCGYARPLAKKSLQALELAAKELTETFKSLFASSLSLSEISTKNSIDSLDNFFDGNTLVEDKQTIQQEDDDTESDIETSFELD